MQLDELLDGIYVGEIEPSFRQTGIFAISCDSRKVMMGSLFVALKGLTHNGGSFIEEAVSKEAFAVATSEDIKPLQENPAYKPDDGKYSWFKSCRSTINS